jgi:hypothetical protein
MQVGKNWILPKEKEKEKTGSSETLIGWVKSGNTTYVPCIMGPNGGSVAIGSVRDICMCARMPPT